ncbi:hypothetical protein HYALB_00014058 [Hymenoscyphus albidus]|uniref:Uncharacterized protein n=1 Tax=Hymenoscyphus albidus TaxID=595503 RepID=A0A9N9M1N3_9HELO|nr:hypothetical protein HYALB_00014058 [Hymenoscyphus albidus]
MVTVRNIPPFGDSISSSIRTTSTLPIRSTQHSQLPIRPVPCDTILERCTESERNDGDVGMVDGIPGADLVDVTIPDCQTKESGSLLKKVHGEPSFSRAAEKDGTITQPGFDVEGVETGKGKGVDNHLPSSTNKYDRKVRFQSPEATSEPNVNPKQDENQEYPSPEETKTLDKLDQISQKILMIKGTKASQESDLDRKVRRALVHQRKLKDERQKTIETEGNVRMAWFILAIKTELAFIRDRILTFHWGRGEILELERKRNPEVRVEVVVEQPGKGMEVDLRQMKEKEDRIIEAHYLRAGKTIEEVKALFQPSLDPWDRDYRKMAGILDKFEDLWDSYREDERFVRGEETLYSIPSTIKPFLFPSDLALHPAITPLEKLAQGVGERMAEYLMVDLSSGISESNVQFWEHIRESELSWLGNFIEMELLELDGMYGRGGQLEGRYEAWVRRFERSGTVPDWDGIPVEAWDMSRPGSPCVGEVNLMVEKWQVGLPKP